MKKLMNKKGFTLMEMLIVVAIIVILVAIAIPTFSSSLDDAKANTDKANLRAAKAVANAMDMTDGWASFFADDTKADAMDITLYFDMEDGVFVKTTDEAATGQSTDNASKYIAIEIVDGKLKAAPTWTEVE